MSTDWLGSALVVFRAACELPEGERAAFLDRACADDASLRRHVEAMLAHDSEELQADHPTRQGAVRAALIDLARDAQAAAVDTTAIPESIGGYRIVRLIGQGGMGVVYEAEQAHPQRRVAIKVARVGGATGESARRFELEAQLLARLQHPGIAQIIEAGTTAPEAGAQPFFVMELVQGQTLTAYAQAHLRDTRARIELMVRVCEAAAFAHHNGVVHRDLKPDNVLIDAAGKPKVLDFGVAKVEAAAGFGAVTLRTEAGRIIGTLRYMAPEQLGGKTEGLGPEADVYSLGVMLYELLTGRLPHELDGLTPTRALALVTSTDAPLLGIIRPEYRGDLQAVVAKALEKEPGHRYADAAALQADLERYLRGEPTLARPAGPVRRVGKWARRNPALATAVFGVFFALATVAGVLLVMNAKVQDALDEFELLADSKRLERAIAEADELAPARPEKVSGIERWLQEYRELPQRRGEYEAVLQRLRQGVESRTGTSWRFTDPTLQLKHDVLAGLVQDLEAFGSDTGLIGRMVRRLDLARQIGWATVDSPERQAGWATARRDVAADRRFDGLVLAPQVGLIPLGQDPKSRLEEFLHLETHVGQIPARDHDGRLHPLDGDTGIIFVLVPGGTFWMGAQSAAEDEPNHDPAAIDGWENIFEAKATPPFFIAKYEMTQGQWERCMGYNPSANTHVPTRPVSMVDWNECTKAMHQLGLALPSELQWERAARAGTTTPYWTGREPASLAGCENISERAAESEAGPWWGTKGGVTYGDWWDSKKEERFDDPDVGRGPAPVGTYLANPFGLFDVSGNVAEWTCDSPAIRHPLPEGQPAPPVVQRVFRGGTFKRGIERARAAWRMDTDPGLHTDEIGLRAAMSIQLP